MKKTFIVLAVLALCVPLLRAADETPVRVFVLKHKRVEEAALLVRPLLSESASVTLTQKLNAMTVTDRPEKLDQIGKVLAAFDVPPRGYTFAVKLVKARADVPAGSIAKEIGGLGAKLKSLFQFNDYALIDSAVLRGVGGQHRSRYQLGDRVHAVVRDPSDGGRQRAAPLAVHAVASSGAPSRGSRASCGRSTARRCPVTLSQTLVVGASKDESLQERAHPDPPGRGGAARRRAEKGAPGPKAVEKQP